MRKHEKSQTKKWIQKPIANNQSNYELKIGLRFWRTFNNQEKETNNLEPEKERSEVQLAKLKIDSPNLTIGQGNSIWVEVRRCVKWIWRSRRSSQKFPVFPPKWGPTWWPGSCSALASHWFPPWGWFPCCLPSNGTGPNLPLGPLFNTWPLGQFLGDSLYGAYSPSPL